MNTTTLYEYSNEADAAVWSNLTKLEDQIRNREIADRNGVLRELTGNLVVGGARSVRLKSASILSTLYERNILDWKDIRSPMARNLVVTFSDPSIPVQRIDKKINKQLVYLAILAMILEFFWLRSPSDGARGKNEPDRSQT